MELNGAKRFSFHTYLAFVVKHPVWALLAIAAITALLAWQLPALSFKTTVYDLIIEELPESVQYNDFQELFGSDEMIRLVVKAEDIFDPATFAKVVQLSEAAGGIDGVRRIISLPEVKESVDIGGNWRLDEFMALLSPVALFQRNLISADGRITIITLVLARRRTRMR